MDVMMPGQKLERVHAIGNAVALSVPDTSTFVSDERDWITGDTLQAMFETLPPTAEDSSERSVMKEVVAIGSARAFYQAAPSGGVKGPPTLSYNRGRQITVLFAEGAMRTVSILDQASGLYLEPIAQRDSVPAPAERPNRGRRP